MALRREVPCDAWLDDDNEDYYMTVPATLDMTPVSMSAEEVDAELHLCSCLTSWVPWATPTEQVNNSLAAIRSQTSASRCMLREQVVSDMMWESVNADSIPPRLKNYAVARYRLQTFAD